MTERDLERCTVNMNNGRTWTFMWTDHQVGLKPTGEGECGLGPEPEAEFPQSTRR